MVKRRQRRMFTAAESAEVWGRWHRGEGLKAIGRVFGKTSSAIFAHLKPHGGIRPAPRTGLRCPRQRRLLRFRLESRRLAGSSEIMPSSDDIAEKMEILRTRFRARCGERSASLLYACERGDAEVIQKLAHDITGSAGLFGFPSLSEQARQLSDGCRDGIADERTLSAAAALSASLLRVAEGTA